MTSRETLVIVPAFNERDCIEQVVADVLGAGFPCLVIDDGSTDGTSAVASAAGAIVLTLPINLGVGGALRAGFRYAVQHRFRCVVQVDADGQHLAEHIDDLLQAATERDLDIVIGSRFTEGGGHPGMSLLRRFCVRVLAAKIKATGTTVTDPSSGFRAIRSPLLEAFAASFPHHYLGDTFEAIFVAAKRGYRIGEIPVVMRERQGGRPSADLYASAMAMLRATSIPLTGTTFDLPTRPQHDERHR